MAGAHPELVFVAGPQAGERAVLSGSVCVAGRSPEADISVEEPYASRQHMQFVYTYEGWVVEVLSPNGIYINDKKYKAKKKILLATDDVIRVGVQTEILFVAPGDDTELAISAYERDHPAAPVGEGGAEQAEPGPPEAGPGPPAEAQGGLATPAAAPRPSQQPQPAQAEAAAVEAADAKRRKKIILYAVLGGVWAVAVIVLFVVLGWLKEKPTVDSRSSGRLDDDEIAEILSAPVSKPRDLYSAGKHLDEARRLYLDRHDQPGNQYLCLKHYKLHLAYAKSTIFRDYRDKEKFERVENDLISQATRVYKEALLAQQGLQWSRAMEALRRLLLMLPENDPNDPVSRKILTEVRDRIKYVGRQAGKRRRR